MSTVWERVARASAGDDYAAAYAERFKEMAARGEDVHGEASYVVALVEPPARVLDAGCGTGRIAVRLHELGYDVVGCDVDASMVEVARRDAPDLDWQVADLADLGPTGLGEPFDLVLVAGNVVPLLEEGTLAAAAAGLAAQLAPGGRLVLGFGLDADHLPDGCPVTDLADVDAALSAAGLVAAERWGSWDRDAFEGPVQGAGGYVVADYVRSRG